MESGQVEPPDIHRVSNALRQLLLEQSCLLDATIHALNSGEGVEDREKLKASDEVVRTILLMVQGTGVSCHSILRLTEEIGMAIRDCFGIARSICETGVNIAYIVAGGAEMARRANQHAMQKSYRDLKRAGEIAGFGFSVEEAGTFVEPEAPGLREALHAYTTAKGHERTSWTPDNLDDRIKVIEARYGRSALYFAGSTISIYRHASEILHGTYFGVVHFWSDGTRPVTKRGDAERLFVLQHFIAVFTASFFSCQGIVEVLSKEFSIPVLARANRALMLEAAKLVEGDLLKSMPGGSP